MFIDFRNRTFFIDIILGFSINIRAFRRNIKIIKIVVNFRKEEIVPLNIIKEIPIRIRKKLDNNRDFLILSEYSNAIYYIMNSNFSFIQIRNDGENTIRIFKGRLGFIKVFIEIEYYHVDPKSYSFVILRKFNSESYSRSSIAKKYDILIIHDINIY
jgi:hypothetical protein